MSTLLTGKAPTDVGTFAPPTDIVCANCGWTPCGHYCPRCGQETTDLHRSLAGILGEMLDAFAGWDGKIPRTLWMLVRNPGALTREFLDGRRVRYLRPLRLYLTMSVLFFLSISLIERPPNSVVLPAQPRNAIVRSDASGIHLDSGATVLIARHRNDRGSAAAWFKRHLVGGLARVKSLPRDQQQRVLRDAFVSHAPNMIFVLLPVFALLLRALYLRTPVYYAEHFVFALHNHAFAYLALTVARATSIWLEPYGLAKLTLVPLLWMPIYFFVSMRRVYGGSRRRTLAKFVALSATYGTILFVATVVTMLMGLLMLA